MLLKLPLGSTRYGREAFQTLCGVEAKVSGGSATSSQSLSPREQARLAAILSRLSSSFDSERAAAGLLATAFIAKHNLTWSDLAGMFRPLPDLPVASAAPRAKNERRRIGAQWRGYCRRKKVCRGRILDLLT
jgi:hypothetical protein